MRTFNISYLIETYKCEQTKYVCLEYMNISRPSLNIQKSVLIGSDLPKKLTINRNALNIVNCCGISHTPPIIMIFVLF